jgi:acyl-CoA thioesterase YciA
MIYRYLVTQPDLNAHGTLHGGMLMKWVDEACGMEARILSGHVCATRNIREIDFRATAKLGDIIEITVRHIETRRTSMSFSATVRKVGASVIANFERLVFVAVNENHEAVVVNNENS